MDKDKLIESLKWKAEMFAHETDVIEEERKEGGIGATFLRGKQIAYTEALEYLENLAEDIENGEYDKTGHWIPVDDKNDAFDCSECIAMVAKKTKYCPGCGAKMVEPQESENKE